METTNLGLDILTDRADGAFLVIVQSVSAALTWTSGGHWSIKKEGYQDMRKTTKNECTNQIANINQNNHHNNNKQPTGSYPLSIRSSHCCRTSTKANVHYIIL